VLSRRRLDEFLQLFLVDLVSSSARRPFPTALTWTGSIFRAKNAFGLPLQSALELRDRKRSSCCWRVKPYFPAQRSTARAHVHVIVHAHNRPDHRIGLIPISHAVTVRAFLQRYGRADNVLSSSATIT